MRIILPLLPKMVVLETVRQHMCRMQLAVLVILHVMAKPMMDLITLFQLA